MMKAKEEKPDNFINLYILLQSKVDEFQDKHLKHKLTCRRRRMKGDWKGQTKRGKRKEKEEEA